MHAKTALIFWSFQVLSGITIAGGDVSSGGASQNQISTLKDYLSVAALNNAELKGSFEAWKGASEEVVQKKYLDDPQFSYTYFIEEVETRVGPQRNKFSISQKFPWFGVIEARTDRAAAKSKAAWFNYQRAKVDLFSEVKIAFHEFVYLATAIDITKENLELVRHFEEVARVKYKVSTATHPDVIRAQIELAMYDDMLRGLESYREPISAKLNSLMNRKTSCSLPWPSRFEGGGDLNLDRDEIAQIILQSNPEISSACWEIAAARSNVELTEKKFYPDISIGAEWIQTGDAIGSGTLDSGKDAVALMFSLNIPIWQDNYKSQVRQAKRSLREKQMQKADIQNRYLAKAVDLIYEMEDLQRKMKLYDLVLIAKAEELIKASESAYKSGSIDFLSLIDSQRKLLEYKLEFERSRTKKQQKIAELEKILGQEMPGK